MYISICFSKITELSHLHVSKVLSLLTHNHDDYHWNYKSKDSPFLCGQPATAKEMRERVTSRMEANVWALQGKISILVIHSIVLHTYCKSNSHKQKRSACVNTTNSIVSQTSVNQQSCG